MQQHESFPLHRHVSDHTIKNLGRLTHTVIDLQQITLGLPLSRDGSAILTNGDASGAGRTTLNCDIDAMSVRLYCDDRPLQVLNVGSFGNRDLMLHQPVTSLDLTTDNEDWTVRMDETNISSDKALNSFLNIVVAHALHRKPAAEIAYLADKFQNS